MPEQLDIESQYEQHQLLRQTLPNSWNAFFARFGSLRPIQLAAVPPILARKNVLVTAPTAGGKTEAVVAPLCEQIIRHRWPGLSVLLITPTRALVNDLFYRLERPCEQMHIAIARKTSDHAFSGTADEQLVITTPESTESLLTFRRETLVNLNAIIIDEIHLLDGTPRGDQLRMLLRRLLAYLHDKRAKNFLGLQTVAMSATVPDPRRLADAYLGDNAEIISVPGQRQVEAKVIVADGADDVRAQAAVQAMELFADVHKVLVFVNSRKAADMGASCFRCGMFSKAPVFGHHGSLSKHQRETTEARFKNERRAICVATMTLEVGIDIGDVDLVVCMDPPLSVSSFLQRIGRGCRRLRGRTRVLCIARDRADEILFDAMIRQATLGLPVGPLKPFRTSVLVQQALAYLKQVNGNCRSVAQLRKTLKLKSLPEVGERRLDLLLADMLQQGLLDRRGEVFQPASAGWEFIQSNRIYSNIQSTPLEVSLIDADSGKPVASVASVDGKRVTVAGRSYQVVGAGKPGQQKVRGTAGIGSSPKYHTVKLPFSADLGFAVAGYLGLPTDVLPVMQVASGIVIITWLGKLLNSALAAPLQSAGLVLKAGAFGLTIENRPSADALPIVKQAVDAILSDNPMDRLKVERMVDVGPYFADLTPGLQELARKDWLDAEFIQRWLAGITRTDLVSTDTQLGADLLELV